MKNLIKPFVFLIVALTSAELFGAPQLVTESLMESTVDDTSQSVVQTYTGGQNLSYVKGEELKTAVYFEVRPGKPVGPRQVLRQRQGLEPLYLYLLRHLIVKFNKEDTTQIIPDQIHQYDVSDQNLMKILNAWNELAKLSVFHQMEASIFSTFVSYTDDSKVEVEKVVVEPGPVFFEKSPRPVSDVQDLVEVLSSQMSKALQLPMYPVIETDYHVAQKDESNVLRYNVLGEPLRVAGITREFEAFLLETFSTELMEMGYNLEYAWFYGSRVLPRTLAVERFGPQIKALGLKLPTTTGHIALNSVREGGLTKLSDIEVLLITSPRKGFPDAQRVSEDKVMPVVRSLLNQKTREFHIGLKIINTPEAPEDSLQAFLLIAKAQVGRGWLPMPNAYVNIHKPQAQPDCGQLMVDPKAQIYDFFKDLVRSLNPNDQEKKSE